jgi:hypothetical protein
VGQWGAGGLCKKLEDDLHVLVFLAFENWVELGEFVVPGCKSDGIHDGMRGCSCWIIGGDNGRIA